MPTFTTHRVRNLRQQDAFWDGHDHLMINRDAVVNLTRHILQRRPNRFEVSATHMQFLEAYSNLTERITPAAYWLTFATDLVAKGSSFPYDRSVNVALARLGLTAAI